MGIQLDIHIYGRLNISPEKWFLVDFSLANLVV